MRCGVEEQGGLVLVLYRMCLASLFCTNQFKEIVHAWSWPDIMCYTKDIAMRVRHQRLNHSSPTLHIIHPQDMSSKQMVPTPICPSCTPRTPKQLPRTPYITTAQVAIHPPLATCSSRARRSPDPHTHSIDCMTRLASSHHTVSSYHNTTSVLSSDNLLRLPRFLPAGS